MSLGTECAKCGAAMPKVARAVSVMPIYRSKFAITGYLCPECKHYNNLKRRGWWKKQNESEATP